MISLSGRFSVRSGFIFEDKRNKCHHPPTPIEILESVFLKTPEINWRSFWSTFRCLLPPSASSNQSEWISQCRRLTSEREGEAVWRLKYLKMSREIPQHKQSQLNFPSYSVRNLHGTPICVSNTKRQLWNVGAETLPQVSECAPHSILVLHLLSYCVFPFRLCLQLYRWHHTTNAFFMTILYPWANNRCYKKPKYVPAYCRALYAP